MGLLIWVGCGSGVMWGCRSRFMGLWGCRSGLDVVVEPCGVAGLGWVWWFAFWSRRGGGAVGVGVVVGLPVD